MRTAKCVRGFLNPRLDNLKKNQLQVRLMGNDEMLELGEEIFRKAEENGECRLGEYSRRLGIKGSEIYHREFITVSFDDEETEEQ